MMPTDPRNSPSSLHTGETDSSTSSTRPSLVTRLVWMRFTRSPIRTCWPMAPASPM
jgi:hypothetical protein